MVASTGRVAPFSRPMVISSVAVHGAAARFARGSTILTQGAGGVALGGEPPTVDVATAVGSAVGTSSAGAEGRGLRDDVSPLLDRFENLVVRAEHALKLLEQHQVGTKTNGYSHNGEQLDISSDDIARAKRAIVVVRSKQASTFADDAHAQIVALWEVERATKKFELLFRVVGSFGNNVAAGMATAAMLEIPKADWLQLAHETARVAAKLGDMIAHLLTLFPLG